MPGAAACTAHVRQTWLQAVAVRVACPCLAQEARLTRAQVADLIDSGDAAGGGTGRHWVLDPIDGTRGFVGMRQYAVCLGMLQEGEVRGAGCWGAVESCCWGAVGARASALCQVPLLLHAMRFAMQQRQARMPHCGL